MDFQEFRLGLYRREERRILAMCWWATAVIAMTESVVFVFFLAYDTMRQSVPVYFIGRFVLPSVINCTVSAASTAVVRNPKYGYQVKNYVVSFCFFLICSVAAVFHNYFRFLLLAPCVPIFISAIFADEKLLTRVFLASIGSYAIAGVDLLRTSAGESLGLRVMTLLCCFFLLLFCYGCAQALQRTQQEQIDFVYSSYQKQIELIHELRIEPLTQLYNRVALRECIESYIEKAQNSTIPLHLVLLDLDYFKQINDRFGHTNGDEVLMTFASIIKQRMGGIRRAFRYGGEEFILLFETETIEQVQLVVDQIRIDFMKTTYSFAPDMHCTFSAGIAPYQCGWDRTAWIMAADEAMYTSKSNGRNCVSIVHN